MRTQNAESWFLSKVDEEKFAEGLQKTLISDYSNPSREGCPDTLWQPLSLLLLYGQSGGLKRTGPRWQNHQRRLLSLLPGPR
jgi:hypothetical protein